MQSAIERLGIQHAVAQDNFDCGRQSNENCREHHRLHSAQKCLCALSSAESRDNRQRDSDAEIHRAQLRIASHRNERHLGRVLVVFAYEHYREFPDRGHIESLVERTVVAGSVAEEGHAHPVRLCQSVGVADPGGHQNARAHDAAGSEHPDFRCKHVHAATAAM